MSGLKSKKSSQGKIKRSVLLLEPDYSNKYPPMGLMKLATYHRRQGWNVAFYKGDLKKFVAERVALRCITVLDEVLPGNHFGRLFPEVASYIKNKDDKPLKPFMDQMSNGLLDFLKILSEYRQVYVNNGYFDWHEWDRVLVTTLFTFYADKTIETIRFAQRLVSNDRIMVGGVMASVVPEYIKKQTGITPVTGLLDTPSIMGDKPIDTNIDDLPLDYSILEEVDYVYPAADAYFAHTTRGCVNKCAFCAVPTLEPVYQSFRPLKDKLEFEKKMFGARSNLLLLDNNVFASASFSRIIDEIKACGFVPGARIPLSDPLELCQRRLADKQVYNEKAWLRKAVICVQRFLSSLKNEDEKKLVAIALEKAHADRDWHGTSKSEVISLIKEIMPVWRRVHKGSWKVAVVDFNQGLDSRLSTKPDVMKKLAEIPIRPVRIAFDHWNLRGKYENAIKAAADANLTHMSNYILYNFRDSPEELYWRLRLNIALCEELSVNIYSFPMKYHPIHDPKWFSNRNYLGEHWCRKYIRFVQTVLIPTMGKIGTGKTFFLKAFGTTTDEFRELLLMPDFMIRNRWNCELSGMVDSWREALHCLNRDEQLRVAEYIKADEYDNPTIFQHDSPRIQTFLHFYSLKETDIPVVSETIKNNALRKFEETWHDANVRMFGDELKREEEKVKLWPFRIALAEKK